MTRVESIERQIEELTREEFAALREWLAERDGAVWDRELEDDIAAGRLDKFAEEVLDEHRRGKTKEL